ncbi:MAG: hypothetical protein GXO35_07850, partial [Gammaproteobacteria bacterium]|nr:hypothetical protein [Gammaproteobacteria bacterium]
RQLDLADWRRRVGAVFQNFGRYAFTLGENVGLADLARLDDEKAITKAARGGGLGELWRLLAGPNSQRPIFDLAISLLTPWVINRVWKAGTSAAITSSSE